MELGDVWAALGMDAEVLALALPPPQPLGAERLLLSSLTALNNCQRSCGRGWL